MVQEDKGPLFFVEGNWAKMDDMIFLNKMNTTKGSATTKVDPTQQLPSGKRSWPWKSTLSKRKYICKWWKISIAMFVYRRVSKVGVETRRKSLRRGKWLSLSG